MAAWIGILAIMERHSMSKYAPLSLGNHFDVFVETQIEGGNTTRLVMS